MKELRLVAVSRDADYFNDFLGALREEKRLRIRCVTSAAEVLEAAAANGVDIVVAAETVREGGGIDLIRQVVKKNPFVNTALVSPLPPGEFHEATEGLGIFMQLSPRPGSAAADKFRELLSRLY